MLSFIELSRQNLLHNINALRSHSGKGKAIMAVVKANAYGHGVKEIVEAVKNSVDLFGVDDVLELEQVRTLTAKPIFVLGYIELASLRKALDLDAILGVYNVETIERIDKEAKNLSIKAHIHIKVDVLLGRQGVLLQDLKSFLAAARRRKNISVDGLYMHFSNVEDTDDMSHALKQREQFQKAQKIASDFGLKNLATHTSSTAATCLFEKDSTSSSMVRLGVGMYGLWPSEGIKKKFKKNISLRPVLRWVTHIAQIKNVPARFPIGYGLSYITSRPMRIAVVPQGYSDGYDRGLSNKGCVLVKGRRCRILGRVAMNMFVIDVSAVPGVGLEDEVVLLGKQGKEEITAEDVGQWAGSINYEIVSRLSPLLPRVIV